MSTLPGGPADKFGNIHEALWGVVGMSKVLGGQADAIRIEEPGTDGAEFYLERDGIKEHWPANLSLKTLRFCCLRLTILASVCRKQSWTSVKRSLRNVQSRHGTSALQWPGMK